MYELYGYQLTEEGEIEIEQERDDENSNEGEHIEVDEEAILIKKEKTHENKPFPSFVKIISLISLTLFIFFLLRLLLFQNQPSSISSFFFSLPIFSSLRRIPFSDKVVLIYTATTYHQEVASSLCCTYHDLGYVVYSFITPSADLASVQEFYGHCVDKWAFIGQENEYHHMHTPDLVIFTTYPLTDHNEEDDFAIMIIHDILKKSSVARFAGMMHHSLILQKYPIPSFIPPHRFTSIYLSEHTYNSSLQVAPVGNSIYLYPIPPLSIIPKYLRDPNPIFLSESTSHARNEVVVQGHFGGRHSWRRNHHNLLQCLQNYQNHSSFNSTRRIDSPSKYNYDISVHFIGKGELDFTSEELHSLKIQHSSELKSFKLFYNEISHGSYLALTQLVEEYYTYRASSSIPAALLTGVPLIMDINLLKLYPCLRESYYHLLISKMSFCESLVHALMLTPYERHQMVNEVFRCRQQYRLDAERKLSNLRPTDD